MRVTFISSGTGNAQRAYTKKRTETFNLHIFKVLKQVHPDIGMSKRAMNVMHGFVHDTLDRIANETGNIVKYKAVDDKCEIGTVRGRNQNMNERPPTRITSPITDRL